MESVYLVEPGMKYFMSETLKTCHNKKKEYYNTIYNICFFLLFITITFIVLYHRYQKRPTKIDLINKETEKKQYILSKIKLYQDIKQQNSQVMITNLPKWD